MAVNVSRGIPFRVAQKPDAVGTLAAEKNVIVEPNEWML